jgi:hypothetical protein
VGDDQLVLLGDGREGLAARLTVPPCHVTPETAGRPSSRRSTDAVKEMVRPATPDFTATGARALQATATLWR